MQLNFEFDSAHRILLARIKGRITNESLLEFYRELQRHSFEIDFRAGILDLSSVEEFAVSSEFIRQLASNEPAVTDATRPRIVVAPTAIGFGLARMFQISGEHTRPSLRVVHTMDEALEELGITSPHFESLE